MARIRWLTALLTLPLLAGGCGAPDDRPASTRSAAIAFCTELGGAWNTPARRCTISRNADHSHVSATYPVDLIGDPTAGPVLKSFLREFFHQHRITEDGEDSTASLEHSVFTHRPDTKSVVFHGDWYVQGTPHPSEDFTTFTFDLATGQQLQLADLFCSGADPLQVLPPLVRPDVTQRIAGTPLSVEDFEPDRGGTDYADDYRAWALDGDDLVLYLPAERSGPVHAGMVTAHLPLTDLRADGCPA